MTIRAGLGLALLASALPLGSLPAAAQRGARPEQRIEVELGLAERRIVLNGKITGLGLSSTDPASGNFSNNLPLPGARLSLAWTRSSSPETPAWACGTRR